jgi:hypothetical protein
VLVGFVCASTRLGQAASAIAMSAPLIVIFMTSPLNEGG